VRQNQIADERSAADTASTLWERKAYRTAQELWVNWLGTRRIDYLNPQLLANTRFQEGPSGTPFDWKLSPSVGVELIRRDGQDVHFLGQENINSVGVQQTTAGPAND
jgi:hypothetical protein